MRGARVVLMGHPDPQRTVGQPRPQALLEGWERLALERLVTGLGQQALRLGIVRRGSGGRCLCPGHGFLIPGHHSSADRPVADCRPVVEHRALRTSCEEVRHVKHAALQLQRSGDAVHGLELVGPVGLPMGMEIDEARCDDQAGRVYDDGAFQRLVGDGLDDRPPDAHVADSVEPRFRIHDTAALKHDIVGLLTRGRSGQEGGGAEPDEGPAPGSPEQR